MHKQKTIAKWLAVILLMTVAVACYIALSAVANANSKTNVAGANDNPETDLPDSPQKPVYSTLPRACEKVDGKSVAHFGGEGEEKLLDAFSFAGKSVLIVSCDSSQYDVKETGIYAAIFSGPTLEKSIRIASAKGRYLCACQTRYGIAIFCAENNETTVKIYDENFFVSCENSIEKFDDIDAAYVQNEIRTFCTIDGKIKSCVLDDSLNVSRDNYVLQTQNAKIISRINFGENELLFLQDDETAIGVTYNRNSGFTKRFSYDKHRILQVMPILQSSSQAFLTLCKTQNGLTLYSHSASLETTAEYTLENQSFGALLRCDNGVNILCKDKCVRLCSHLDFISETSLDYLYENKKISSANDEESYLKSVDTKPLLQTEINVASALDFTCVAQEENIFVARFDGFDLLVEFEDGKLVNLCKFNYKNNAIITKEKCNDQARISLFFDSDLSSDLTYMRFGKSDVFFISVLTNTV